MFFDDFMRYATTVLTAIPFSGPTIFVMVVLGFIVWLFMKADKNPKSPVAWEDLLLDPTTNRVSPYNVAFLVGLIVGTWIVVVLVGQGNLHLDIFGAYLTYLLGGTGIHVFNTNKKPTLDAPDYGATPPPAD